MILVFLEGPVILCCWWSWWWICYRMRNRRIVLICLHRLVHCFLFFIDFYEGLRIVRVHQFNPYWVSSWRVRVHMIQILPKQQGCYRWKSLHKMLQFTEWCRVHTDLKNSMSLLIVSFLIPSSNGSCSFLPLEGLSIQVLWLEVIFCSFT